MYDIHRRRGRTKRYGGDCVAGWQNVVCRQLRGLVMVVARRVRRASEADTVPVHEPSVQDKAEADDRAHKDPKHILRGLEVTPPSVPTRRYSIICCVDSQGPIQH